MVVASQHQDNIPLQNSTATPQNQVPLSLQNSTIAPKTQTPNQVLYLVFDPKNNVQNLSSTSSPLSISAPNIQAQNGIQILNDFLCLTLMLDPTKSSTKILSKILPNSITNSLSPTNLAKPIPKGQELQLARGDLSQQIQLFPFIYSCKRNSRSETNMRNPTYQNSDPKLGTTTTLSDLVDLDVLLIVEKCVRLCTIHPISKFVKYDHQSKVVQALVTNFAKTKILKTIHEAWQDPMGKKAKLEDMHA